MTNEKVLEVVRKYDRELEVRGAEVKSYAISSHPDDHLRYMCHQIEVMIGEGRREKAMRWLGFMQGVMWEKGRYTIAELADHNRPTADDVAADIANDLTPSVRE